MHPVTATALQRRMARPFLWTRNGVEGEPRAPDRHEEARCTRPKDRHTGHTPQTCGGWSEADGGGCSAGTGRRAGRTPRDGSSRGAVRAQWAQERASGGQTGIVNKGGFQSPKSVLPRCDNSVTTLCCLKLPRTEPDRSRGGRGSSEPRAARVHAGAHGSEWQLSRRHTPLPSTDHDTKLTPLLCGRPSAHGHAPPLPGQPRPGPELTFLQLNRGAGGSVRSGRGLRRTAVLLLPHLVQTLCR